MTREEELAAIERVIAERGVTKCPPQGWKRREFANPRSPGADPAFGHSLSLPTPGR
jgi:hypothetical protein